MKQIYFVRHGQTNHNVQRVFQDDSENLNDCGIQQAKLVANRFINDVEVIITSPLRRTQETADIIAKTSGCKLETLDILKEMMNPPIVRGKSYDDPVASEAYDHWLEKILADESYGRDDVENFFDLSLRAHQILNILNARSEEKIVVVTHSVTIRAILACIIMGEKTSPDIIEYFQNHIKINNTGVVCINVTYDNNGKTRYKILFE